MEPQTRVLYNRGKDIEQRGHALCDNALDSLPIHKDCGHWILDNVGDNFLTRILDPIYNDAHKAIVEWRT